MIALPLLIHAAFLAVYTALVAMLLWHYHKYSLPHDPARWVIRPFVVFSVIFAVLATILFFYVPWEDLARGLFSSALAPQFEIPFY
ncbi:MAG: hypothetical protein HYS44_00970 [Candidatus Niyogibacteria bacterium]|nr:hypothetical protein [Candidatus Niyogibacteria bacterium]